jgi:uncharacterized protein involved in response to NO
VNPKLPVLAYAFRPFFLLAAVYAIVLMCAWIGTWFLAWPVAGSMPPIVWHGHEMVFGLVPAIVAGFLLTAICNWTGHPPLSGRPLLALLVLWLAGRVTMWSSAWIPAWVLALIDSAFLLALALYVGFVVAHRRNRRNVVIVGISFAYWLAGLSAHLGYLGIDLPVDGQRMGLMLIVLLLTVIGGRITPAFTRNWLRRQQADETIVFSRPWLEQSSFWTLSLLVVVVALPSPGWLIVIVGGLSGLLHGLRLVGWSGWVGRSDPLIWVLHLGYAWLVAGLLLLTAGQATALVPPSLWTHVLGVGAMGTLVLGVMTRVSLGHTGRPLVLPTGAASIYWMMMLAAVARLVHAAGLVDSESWLLVSATAWVGSFTLFLVFYSLILLSPRADGRPG